MTHSLKKINRKLIRNLGMYRIQVNWLRMSMNSKELGQFWEMNGIFNGSFLSVAQIT
jgi:hypothetical protein